MTTRNRVFANLHQLSLMVGISRPKVLKAWKDGKITTRFFTATNQPIFDTEKLSEIRTQLGIQ